MSKGNALRSTESADQYVVEVTPRYGEVICARPKSTAVYAAKFGNGKSTKAIEVSVPVPAVGLIIDSTIYARLEVKPDQTIITFEASVPRGLSFGTDGERDAFLAHAENAAVAWPGYGVATENAEARLMGIEVKAADGAASRPRLVKRVVAALVGVRSDEAAARLAGQSA